jgi:hypothetical protein
MFAVLAAVMGVLAVLHVIPFQLGLLWWLIFVALHFAFGWFLWTPPWSKPHQ